MATTDLVDRVLSQGTPAKVRVSAVRLAGSTIQEIDVSLPRALEGERGQVRAYVKAYRELTGRVLDAVGSARPDLIMIDEQHHVVVAVEAKRPGRHPKTVSWVKAALEQEAMNVPFSDWVGTYGSGKGAAMAVVALLRTTLPGVEPLMSPAHRRLPSWQLGEPELVRFSRSVLDELSRTEAPLEHVASVLGLTQTELAKLFGVRRQALEQWAVRGVPAERQEKLATLGAIADLLAIRLKRERIPGVVRRPASAYAGRSILAAIADGDETRVLSELRDAFDWAAAA